MAYDALTVTALESGQLIIRDYITVFGWDFDGEPVTFAWWTGEDDVTVEVISAIDGLGESRDFIGGGTFLDVPPIVDTIGLEAGEYELGLSQIHAAVQDMVRGNSIRVAAVELHRGLLSPSTWSLVSTPFPRLLGRIDGAAIETPEAGGEGGTRLVVVADAVDLTRTSPALKSDETQRLRSGDRFRRHSDSAAAVEVWWGQAKGPADGQGSGAR